MYFIFTLFFTDWRYNGVFYFDLIPYRVEIQWCILFLPYSLQSGLGSSVFGVGLPSHATSTPFNPALRHLQPTPRSGDVTSLQSITHSSGSSGISSIRSDLNSNDPTPVPQSFLPV